MIQSLEYDYTGALCSSPKTRSKNVLTSFENAEENFFSHTSLEKSLGLSICKFTPQKAIIMKEKMATTNLCMMSFCLGENIEWSFAETPGKQLEIERNESCIMTGGTKQCVSAYREGAEYYGIGTFFDYSQMQSVAECLQCENAVNNHNSLANGLKSYVITPHVHAILSQIVGCDICGNVRNLYLEAKLLELIAVYLDEMVCQRRDEPYEFPLSKEDLHALNRAKEILDKTFVHPLTLAELSQKIYLNEYKLKTGFKQCFGQTVYSYVLDKKMELARILIEQRRFKISDIAGMVGYANTSHFIAAFSKKYGVTPGEYGRIG